MRTQVEEKQGAKVAFSNFPCLSLLYLYSPYMFPKSARIIISSNTRQYVNITDNSESVNSRSPD
jgi:hypothetical protein